MLTTVLIVFAVISFVVAMEGHLRGEKFLMEMIAEINRKLPEEDQISEWGFYPSKYGRIYRDYRRLYPEGKLLRNYWVAGAAGAVGLLFMVLFLLVLTLVLDR